MKNKRLWTLCVGVLVLGFVLAGFTDDASGQTPKRGKSKKETKEAVKQAPAVSPEEAFRKNFPNIKFDSINPTEIKGVYEVVVMSTVTAKVGERVMFLIEAKQAGIFQVRNVSTEDLEPILAVMCPNILFPYLREVVSDISTRAGFAPVLLNPINFETLYQQQKQQEQTATASTH